MEKCLRSDRILKLNRCIVDFYRGGRLQYWSQGEISGRLRITHEWFMHIYLLRPLISERLDAHQAHSGQSSLFIKLTIALLQLAQNLKFRKFSGTKYFIYCLTFFFFVKLVIFVCTLKSVCYFYRKGDHQGFFFLRETRLSQSR